MIFTLSDWASIADGRVTVALRRWTTARVKPGSRIRSSLGVIEIRSIDAISTISEADAQAAGFASAAEAAATVDRHQSARSGVPGRRRHVIGNVDQAAIATG